MGKYCNGAGKYSVCASFFSKYLKKDENYFDITALRITKKSYDDDILREILIILLKIYFTIFCVRSSS